MQDHVTFKCDVLCKAFEDTKSDTNKIKNNVEIMQMTSNIRTTTNPCDLGCHGCMQTWQHRNLTGIHWMFEPNEVLKTRT